MLLLCIKYIVSQCEHMRNVKANTRLLRRRCSAAEPVAEIDHDGRGFWTNSGRGVGHGFGTVEMGWRFGPQRAEAPPSAAPGFQHRCNRLAGAKRALSRRAGAIPLPWIVHPDGAGKSRGRRRCLRGRADARGCLGVVRPGWLHAGRAAAARSGRKGAGVAAGSPCKRTGAGMSVEKVRELNDAFRTTMTGGRRCLPPAWMRCRLT